MDSSANKLERSLSLTDLLFFGVASIIGSGGFNLIGEAIVKGGNWWPLTLGLSTAVFMGSSYTYEKAYESSKTNTSESDYVHKILGDNASTVTTGAILLWNIVSIGTILVLSSHILFPDASWLGQIGFALFILIFMSLFSLKGININKESINFFSAILVAFLTVITGLGITGVAQKGLLSIPTMPEQSFILSMLFFYFILAGFDALIKFSEETKDEKDIPRAFYLSNGISFVLTLGMCLAFISWVNIRKVDNFENSIGDLVGVFVGQKSKPYVSLVAVTYMIITSFVAFLATTRYIFSLAEQHSELSILLPLNENKAPVNSIFFTSITSALTIMVNHVEKLVRAADFGLSTNLLMVALAATKAGIDSGKIPIVEGLTSASFVGLMGLSFI